MLQRCSGYNEWWSGRHYMSCIPASSIQSSTHSVGCYRDPWEAAKYAVVVVICMGMVAIRFWDLRGKFKRD